VPLACRETLNRNMVMWNSHFKNEKLTEVFFKWGSAGTHAHTHTHARPQTCTGARAHTHLHTHLYTYLHARAHTCTYSLAHASAHTCTRALAHVSSHARTACENARTRAHRHTRAHTHLHTHTHTHEFKKQGGGLMKCLLNRQQAILYQLARCHINLKVFRLTFVSHCMTDRQTDRQYSCLPYINGILCVLFLHRAL
jgi:hypothetical protein